MKGEKDDNQVKRVFVYIFLLTSHVVAFALLVTYVHTCRHQRRTPDFELHAVGRHGDHPGCSFWRDYSLTIPGIIDCYIRETFVEGLLEDSDESYSRSRCHGDGDGGTIWYNAANPNLYSSINK